MAETWETWEGRRWGWRNLVCVWGGGIKRMWVRVSLKEEWMCRRMNVWKKSGWKAFSRWFCMCVIRERERGIKRGCWVKMKASPFGNEIMVTNAFPLGGEQHCMCMCALWSTKSLKGYRWLVPVLTPDQSGVKAKVKGCTEELQL